MTKSIGNTIIKPHCCQRQFFILLIIFSFIPAAIAAPQMTGAGPSSINVCDSSPITYTLTIANPSGSSANNLALAVTIPSGFHYAGSTSISYPSIANPCVTSSQGPGGSSSLTWDLSSIINSQKSLVINEIYPNPSGSATKQIEIMNSGSFSVDLTGWLIKNSAGTTIAVLTAGTSLEAGAFLAVQTPGLIITGDIVGLYDSSGVKRDSVTYPSGSGNQGKSYACVPDASRSVSAFAWRTPTLGASNGAGRGDLNIGETITLSFTMKADCSAADGQNLNAVLTYTGGSASFTTSSTFLVNRGLLKILKTPAVASASVDDIADYNITVENIGTGPAYNVVMVNRLGAGLEMQTTSESPDISSPPNYTWNLGAIAAGSKKTIKVSEKVVKCTEIYDEAQATWGCDNESCQNNYAKASVKIILRAPEFSFSLPSSVTIPYCGKAAVSIPYANSGDGKANHMYFLIEGLKPQYEIGNVTGCTYNESSQTLVLGDVAAGASGTIAFELRMRQGACDAPSSGVLAFRPNYYDECDKPWAPPTKYFTFSMDGSKRPSIVVTKDGPDSLYLGDTGTYEISALYSKGVCSAENVTVDIVDTFPTGFEIDNYAGGTVNDSAHTITWKQVKLEDGKEWSPDGGVVMKASTDPCDCGRSFVNSVTTSQIEDCCGCTLSGEASKTILVECNDGFSSSKSASPASQESCRDITYKTTYHFDSVVGLHWSNMNFTEQGNNGQTFPNGATTGNASFTVRGPGGDLLGSTGTSITLGVPVSLSLLDESWLVDGCSLEIVCTLRQPNTGSFVDWSDLNIAGRPSKCGGDRSFHEGVFVSVGQSDFSIGLVYPQKMNSCGTYTFAINLTQNGIWAGDQMNISYDDTNFRYLGNAEISGILSGGTPVASFEPTRSGNVLTWSLGDDITCDGGSGSITFSVQKTCNQDRLISADLKYLDNCKNLHSGSASGSPLLLDRANLILKKTPEVIFASNKLAKWRIYVTNSGSGTAYNVQLVDTLDSGLSYISGTATLNGLSIEPQKNGQSLTWNLLDMAPNARNIVEFDSRLVGCQNLNNNVLVRWGCGGDTCQEATDSSKVELVWTTLQAIKHSYVFSSGQSLRIPPH